MVTGHHVFLFVKPGNERREGGNSLREDTLRVVPAQLWRLLWGVWWEARLETRQRPGTQATGATVSILDFIINGMEDLGGF